MTKRQPKPRSHPGLLVIVSALGASAMVLLAGTRFLVSRWNEANRIAELQCRNLSHSIQQNISGSLREINLALGDIESEVEWQLRTGKPDLPRLTNFLATVERNLPESGPIRVTDAQGRVLVGKPTGDPSTGHESHPYFKLLASRPASTMVVSKPLSGLILKRWVIPCARRYDLPDGRFGGVIVIPVFIEHFQRVLGGFEVPPGGTLSLRDGDGGFICRYPPAGNGPVQAVGDPNGSAELSGFIKSGLPEESHFARAPFDGVPRLYNTHRIPEAPMMIGVGLAQEDYLAQWRRDRARTVALMVVALVSAWAMAALLLKAWRGHSQAARAFQRSEARYRTLINHASEGILVHSLEGNVIEVNEAFAQMHGYAPDELLKLNLKDLNVPGTFRKHPERLKRILAGEALTFEVHHVHRDGHAFPVEVLVSQVGKDGVPILLAFHRDITQRRKDEEERHALVNQLQQAQKMESLGTLAGGIAHDMNNILGAILVLASSKAESLAPDTPAHRAFGTIAKAAVRGGDMVRRLLAFAHQTPAEESDLDLNAILLEQAGLLERTTLAKVRLATDLAPDLAPMRGNAGALANAFMNLCVNAVDAMPDSGTLRLTTRNADGWVEVQVEDTGTGMPQEVLARAMEPFFTTKAIGKGTGLGLSMVYSTVKAHGGQIHIRSNPGLGTLVTIRFPAARPLTEAAALPPEAAKATPGRRLRVLLVDDDALILESLEAVLRDLGHEAVLASTGEEALALLATGYEPEVVILDLNMPGLGGAGTLPRLQDAHPGVPILLSTGRLDPAALELAAAFPQVTLLPKPFDREELQRRLEERGGPPAGPAVVLP